MDPIRMDRKYKTRDGRPVRILTIHADGPWPVVVQEKDATLVYQCSSDGLCSSEPNRLDLIPATEEVTLWVNVYWRPGGSFHTGNCDHKTAEEAVSLGRIDPGYIATVPITFKVPS